MGDDKVLSRLKLLKDRYLYARKKFTRTQDDLEGLPLIDPKTQVRLVRSTIDEHTNNYFLSINAAKPPAKNQSGTSYTIQVKPIDLSEHIEYVRTEGEKIINARINEISKGKLSDRVRESKKSDLDKIRKHLADYCASNSKYDRKFGDIQRQEIIWHTIAADVETPKNIYLDKELLLLDKSLFYLDFGPFDNYNDALKQVKEPWLDPGYQPRRVPELIAFELRVLCKVGIEERTIFDNNQDAKIFFEKQGKHPDSSKESNLLEVDWGNPSSFVNLLKEFFRM